MTIESIDLQRVELSASGANEPGPVLPTRRATPVRWPVMVQRWTDVVFLHWRFDPGVVQALLPGGVTVDTHDGSAWVGLVPFQMEGLGVPGLAPLPHVGRFPEVNVRTYVRAGRRRGVWFFSLDVDRLLPAVVARVAYHLPYCAGRAHHVRNSELVVSRVERRWPRADDSPVSEIVVKTGAAVDPDDELIRFLTDRWGLISSTRRGGLRYAAVDHPAWSLHAAEVVHLADGLVAAAGLPAPHATPHVMWSPGVDVRVGRPQRAI
ncbi:MAG: DUF2071 domain-containing protein [Acidimicrobiia bacterium]|nr:DUF2071 domain-containing protein [Acidimicrobiia bacterium]